MKSIETLLAGQSQVDGIFRGIVAGEAPSDAERTVSPAIGQFAVLENARLRELVAKIAHLRMYGDGPDDVQEDGDDAMRVLNYYIAAARKALAKVPA